MVSQNMQLSADDIAAAREMLSRSTSGEVTQIVTLTDEEIIILDGLQNEQLVALPWLAEHDGVDRELVGSVALRSLLARGMVVPRTRPVEAASVADPAGDGSSENETEVGIAGIPEITGPLVLRRTAQAILAAERHTTLGEHWVYLYFHQGEASNDTVIEEEVTSSGHHAFCVYPAADLGDRLAVFLDPAGSAVMDGTARSVKVSELESQAASTPGLAEARAVTTLTTVRAGSDAMRVATVYTGPRGVFLMEGGERAENEDAQLTIREVGPRTLRGLPLALVSA